MENAAPLIILRQNFIENTKIFSGNAELIDSRSVTLFDNTQPLEIEETFSSQFKILIRLFFEKSEDNKQTIKINADATTSIIDYKCFNFDNPLGTCTQKPIEIATINDKKIYFHFWVYLLGESDTATRKVEYSIWKEK